MSILIAGFQHETNTFAPTKADYEKFVHGGGYPPLCRGEALSELKEMNIPLGGFMKQAEHYGYKLIPVLWAGAAPSAHVTQTAYEKICGEIFEAIKENIEGITGVYLDLHGAMVCEHVDDGEGELLVNIRALIGKDIPLVASLDLHANVTDLMLQSADILVTYRTYPHIDMADSGYRSAIEMHALLNGEKRYLSYKHWPFLTSINAQCTFIDPAKSTIEFMENLEKDVKSLSLTTGFPASDFEGCGGTVWGYDDDPIKIEKTVNVLYQKILADEALWDVDFLEPDEAVEQAILLSKSAQKPVIIADTQDNPGAGGDSNTMGMIKALLKANVENAAVGLITDPVSVQKAIDKGLGKFVELELGGCDAVAEDSPLKAIFRVESISDGQCQYDGPMMNGVKVSIGSTVCLSIDGLKIVVCSEKAQMLDRNLFKVAGIIPEEMTIVVVKSSVHFRADFQPIAEEILIAKAPGPLTVDPADIPWKNLKKGIRLKPLGMAF